MSMNDPIADMLTRIRNGQSARKKTVSMPASTMKARVLTVLKNEGYISGFETATDEAGHPVLEVELKYFNNEPVIKRISRVSTPGLRQYSASQKIPMVANGLGVTIVSTSKGVMSDQQARKFNLGGEIICQVF